MATTNLRTTGQRFSAKDRRRQILDTATELFARQGFKGTTTREIAERAQVNEAIIFRHFPTKEDLYWAVIDHKCNAGHGRQIVADHVATGAPPEELFTAIAREFLTLRRRDSSLARLMLYSALEDHKLSGRFFQTHIAELYQALAEYIRTQIKAGRFREVDPLLAARGFWGMVVYHFLVQEIFGAKRYQEFDIEETSRTLTDVWLRGMLPHNEADKRARRKSGKAVTSETHTR